MDELINMANITMTEISPEEGKPLMAARNIQMLP